MAEEAKDAKDAKEAPKKKKSKLPMLMAVAVLLIGGGFFFMNSRTGKGKKEVPKVELAAKDTDLEEFLTNTANPAIYVRAKLSVRLVKDYEEAKFKEHTADVRDAVLLVLNSTQPADITDASKRSALKKRLAKAMNEAISDSEPKKDADKPQAASSKSDSKDVKDDGDKKDDAPDSKPAAPPKKIVPPDCDSETGPVFKVRFNSLATQ
jgi:flagellar basal body-associated protein FliL